MHKRSKRKRGVKQDGFSCYRDKKKKKKVTGFSVFRVIQNPHEDEKMNKKVKKAILKRVNYIVAAGKKEQDDQTISYRTIYNKELNTISIKQFIQKLKQEMKIWESGILNNTNNTTDRKNIPISKNDR